MNPTQLIFNSASQLTGGIVSDCTSACLAMVGIFFIMIGLDYLKDAIEVKMHQRGSARREEESYEKYASNRETREKYAGTYSATHDFNGPMPSNKPKGDGVYF